jgi:phage tail protein X
MATTYTTREGDTLDYIAWKYYGSVENGVVEQVFLANPNLADLGVTYPYGVVINLPEFTSQSKAAGIKLWD